MQTQTITLTKSKDCKHSVCFEASKDAVYPIIRSVYITRPSATGKEKVTITVAFE